MGLHRSSPHDAFGREEKRFPERLRFSPVDMLEKLLLRKWVFLAIIATCIGLSVSYFVMSSPVYHAEAVLSGFSIAPDKSLADELGILRSRSIMLKAMDTTVAQAVVSPKHPVPLVGGFLSTILPREPNALVDAPFAKPNWSWGGEHIVFKSYEVPDNQLGKALELEFSGDRKWKLRDTEGRELLSGSVGRLSDANGFKVEISEIVAHPKTVFTVTRETTWTRLEQIQKVFSATEIKHPSSAIRLSYEDVDPVFGARFVNAVAAAYLDAHATLRAANSARTNEEATRDIKANSQLSAGLMNNARQMQVAEAATLGNAVLLDQALVPVRPVKPKRTIALLLGAVLGVLLGFIVTQLLPLLSRRVRDPKRLETAVNIQTLGVLPLSPHPRDASKANASPFMLSREQSNAPLVEAMDALAHSLQHKFKSKDGAKVVLVTSAVPGQGKSMLCANLAYLYAKRGLKTLVINADSRRSNLHRYLSLTHEEGLAEVLQGRIDVAQAIDTPFENLHVLSAQTPLSQARNSPEFERLGTLIDSLRDRYDMVAINSPPVLPITDAAALCKVADATILVARQGMVSYAEVAQSVSHLHKAGANIDGLIFNGFESVPLRDRFSAQNNGSQARLNVRGSQNRAV
jgi:capsular exopolysaccharide synthesis family protein